MSQLFVGIRKENGQIGYLSESLSIPEFFNLVRPRESSNVCNLVDFSPMIEALHDIHNERLELSIRAEYNAVYNYWRDATTFADKAVILSRSEGLAKSSNDFLTKMDFKIDESLRNYGHRRTTKLDENYKVVQEFGRNVDAYIDVLLCFIHSKASLEIASFKHDHILTKYASTLIEKIKKMYFDVVEYNSYTDSIDSASILNFIALRRCEELDSYLKLLPSPHNSRDLKSELFENAEIVNSYNKWNREMDAKIEITYRIPDSKEDEMARILRDLAMKALSLYGLIDVLKTKEVQWDPSNNSIKELTQLIEKKGI